MDLQVATWVMIVKIFVRRFGMYKVFQVVKITLFLLFMFLLCLSYTPSYSHSGKTDKNGGHRDSKTGKYHYHKDSKSIGIVGSGC